VVPVQVVRRVFGAGRVGGLILVLFGVWTSSAGALRLAEAQSSSRADEAAVRSYSLSMPKFEAWAAATAATQRAVDGLPENDARALRVGADASIDHVASIYDRIPVLRNAVRDQGLTTREFTVIGLAMIQALTVDAALRYNPKGSRPDNINPANLKFVELNRTVIEKRMSAWNAR